MGDTCKTKTIAKLLSDPVYTMVCKNTWNKYLPCIKDYFNCFQKHISLFSTYQVTVLEYLIQYLICPPSDSITKRHLLFMLSAKLIITFFNIHM